MSFNQTIQTLTFVWNEKRFMESKSARDAARRSLFKASTILFNSELKNLENQNDEIRHEIDRCYSDLQKYNDKLQILDNMTQLATQSLEVYFQARMENLRTFVTEQCRIISDGIQEEADHWKEIHAMLQQKLVVPGDLRSYGGGNGLPRPVRQSPNFSQIVEEDEEEETKNNASTLLQSRTLTPLITQTLKKARLLASKLSKDISIIDPPQLNISTTVNEQTLIEEPQISSTIPDNHLTLRDVSAIENALEIEHNLPNSDLSISLLPCIPTKNIEEEKEINKSITSTISDKTFVKTTLNQFSSEDESNDDDDNTVIEESLSVNNTRPLLLTADRSIRHITQPIKERKLSLLINKNTFDAEKSDYVRPTIIDNSNTIPCVQPIVKEEKSNVLSQSETKSIDEKETINQTIEQTPVETKTKRRTTRLLRENQNHNLSSQQPVELPIKSRYATRYSTRLASTIIKEDITIQRRTTRFISE